MLFADINGFTRFSESRSLASVFSLVIDFVATMDLTIRRHGGFINSLEGDGVVALFPDNADNVPGAAISARQTLLDTHNFAKSSLDIGIGVHSGSLLLGAIGNEEWLKCDILGDAVNLCARIEQLTRNFGTHNLVSEEYRSQLSEELKLRGVGQVVVRGRKQPVRLYEVLDALETGQRDLRWQSAALFDKGVEALESGHSANAADFFNQALESDPTDTVAEVMLKFATDHKNFLIETREGLALTFPGN